MTDKTHQVASDWEIAFLGGTAAARGGGAGMFFSVFRSKSLDVLEPFYLTASGIGMGGNATGFDPNNMKGLNFSAVDVRTPFSVSMLHLAAGFIVSAGIGAPFKIPANYGFARMNAGRNGAIYFEVGGTGPSVGSGTGVYAFSGVWYSHRLNNNSANPVSAYGDSFMQSVRDLFMEWDRGIRDIYMPRF